MDLAEFINSRYRASEEEIVAELLTGMQSDPEQISRVQNQAYQLIKKVRHNTKSTGYMDQLLRNYKLTSPEGIMLMALAESYLRVPDQETAHELLKDKLQDIELTKFLIHPETWITKVMAKSLKLTQWFLAQESGKKLTKPFIHAGISRFMHLLAHKFVMGRTITEALHKAKKNHALGYCHSFDMLGEAACTQQDAERYFKAYLQAIESLHHTSMPRDGISVKLSALHPRYSFMQQARILPELIDLMKTLAIAARHAEIPLTMDAEEAENLELSLRVFEGVARDPKISGWQGFGLAVQAYQKRAPAVLDWVVSLAQACKTRFNVRLVKGAYWDSEIKWTQERGLNDYPVFTRKYSTDLSYLYCAQRMLNHPQEIYAAFATHNAYTIAAVLDYAKDAHHFEFQCLYGMDQGIYASLLPQINHKIPLRIYAPVGHYQDLLPYLVRRLLENGANSSFINALVDPNVPIDQLIKGPIQTAHEYTSKRHPKIPLPCNLYKDRKNSRGIDFSNMDEMQPLLARIAVRPEGLGGPIINGALKSPAAKLVASPIDHLPIGKVQEAEKTDLEEALSSATNAFQQWKLVPVEDKANILEKIGQAFEENTSELVHLCVYEGGKTIVDSLAEVREAVDYCRYYAAQAREHLASPLNLPGPTGEQNKLHLKGRGTFLCISPWNFPLAIFTGQVVAALVSGNCVLAKPASQTVLLATKAIKLMHQAGIPLSVLHLIPAPGSIVGKSLLTDSRIGGVCFTGSTETGWVINQALASRRGPIVPLIAETGGQNAMIVDSTALPEQVVKDVIASAFNSAGQRCSALRLLFLQEEIAPRICEMLKGAMSELVVGDPRHLTTDIGPVIDMTAQKNLDTYVEILKSTTKLLCEVPLQQSMTLTGNYIAPRAFMIGSLEMLSEEHFGPILHIVTFKLQDLEEVIHKINQLGFGLTFGLHSRIQARIQKIADQITAGNMYVNRNMIGAVVGAQPFGGQGLSGTGPKAGGPHYLYRFMTEQTISVNTTAQGGNTTLVTLDEEH